MNNQEGQTAYEAKDIKSLEGIELIRSRPSLFLDGLDSDGLHRLIFEAIDNSVDEFRAGFGGEVHVTIDREGVVEVSDVGRGIPHGVQVESGMPVVVFLMTKSFAGAKFEKGVYNFSGGLHGVGLKCINAFSEWVDVSTCRDGKTLVFKFIDGVYDRSEESVSEKTGTKLRFLPKYDIFGGATFDRDRVCARLEDSSYLNPGLRCVFSDGGDASEFYAPDGVKGLLLERGCADVFSAEAEDETLKIECHLGVDPRGDTVSVSYANGIPTPEGGSHIAGVKNGIARALNSYAGRRKLARESDPVIGPSDISEGCYLVVALVSDAPPFSSQKKTRIVSPEIETRCGGLITGVFLEWLDGNPVRAKHAVQRAIGAAKNREKLKAMKARLRLASKAKKLKKPSCVLSGGGGQEILICVRDPLWRGFVREGLDILPVFPKATTSPAKAPLEKILKNPDFFSVAAALGGGVGSLDDDPEGGFRVEGCRYEKLSVRSGRGESARMAAGFILSFLEHHLPGLIESGRVYWQSDEGEFRVTTGQSLKGEIIANGEGGTEDGGGGGGSEIDRENPLENEETGDDESE